MAKDSYRTKNWRDKVRVWFSRTTWRPEDVEKKFPYRNIDQNDKFDPKISPNLMKFVWIQLIFIPFMTLVVFFTLKSQSFLETAIFGISLFLSSIIISLVLSNKVNTIIYESIRSVLVLSIIYSGIISIELLAAQVLAIHALFNIGMIIIYRFFIHKEEDLITN